MCKEIKEENLNRKDANHALKLPFILNENNVNILCYSLYFVSWYFNYYQDLLHLNEEDYTYVRGKL